jgi:hypothetical protein
VDDGDDHMDENDEDVVHPGIYQNLKERRNSGPICNSPPTGARVAAYLRVSTHQQDLERQLQDVEWLREAYGWKIDVFKDKDVDSEILLEHRPDGADILAGIR